MKSKIHLFLGLILFWETAQTYMQMAMMMKKLKAADPTIVPGPKSPASKLLPTISITESRISGAEAIRKKKCVRTRLKK
jgi:hypothetical protein